MNFFSCKALPTPHIYAPHRWIRMVGWPFKFKTKFEFEWATNLSALTLSSFSAPFITRENISHEITHAQIKPHPPLLTPLVDRDKLISIWIQNLIWIQMCNYSSLSFLLDKTFDVVIKGGEEWGVKRRRFLEKNSRAWGSLVHDKEIHILPREKERKERKVGAKFPVSSLEF